MIPDTDPSACLIWLVRHGATPHNLLQPPRMQGRGIDQPLSDLGRQQAQSVARLLAGRPVAEIFASPLLRAMETAGVIAERHGQTVQPLEAVAEVDVGQWEDRSWDWIKQNDAEHYQRFRQDPVTHGYPGGENMQQAADRVGHALHELATQRAGKELVVVAHSVVNRTYLARLVGLPPSEGHRIPQTNCSANLIRFLDGKAKAVTINSVAHLMG